MQGWQIAAFTHRGRVRSTNEDSVSINRDIFSDVMDAPYSTTLDASTCVLMVADGLGGHGHGALASRLTLAYLAKDIEKLAEPSLCRKAIRDANDHLYACTERKPETAGMGTTLVGAALTSANLLIFNVGDSRAYLNSRDQLIQLSQDDTLANSTASLSRQKRSIVTQAIGGSYFHVPIDPHFSRDPPLADDETLLLCSDGLSSLVSDELIREMLGSDEHVRVIAANLVSSALSAGGLDNISVILSRRRK